MAVTRKALDDIEVCDGNDLRAILDSTNISREDLVICIMEASEDKYDAFIDALKKDDPVYGAMKSELDRWYKLNKLEQRSVLERAYDLFIE